jgi:hypothetical protein
MQMELVSDIPEDGKPIMPKRVGCKRILIEGAGVFKVIFINLESLLHIKLVC